MVTKGDILRAVVVYLGHSKFSICFTPLRANESIIREDSNPRPYNYWMLNLATQQQQQQLTVSQQPTISYITLPSNILP